MWQAFPLSGLPIVHGVCTLCLSCPTGWLTVLSILDQFLRTWRQAPGRGAG